MIAYHRPPDFLAIPHLEDVATRPNVTLQVLPFSAESQPGGDAPIMIVEYADKPTVGLAEGGVAGILSGDRAEVAQAAHVVNLIRAVSLFPPTPSTSCVPAAAWAAFLAAVR